MSTLPIRTAEPEDTSALIALIDIASTGFVPSLFAKLAPQGMSVTDYIATRMAAPESGLSYDKLWVIELDGSIAGFIALDQTPETVEPIHPDTPAMFRPLTELENMAPGCCLINLVATFPEFRGRGVATALMAFADMHRGTNGLCLTVGDTNLTAQGLYRRLGYREMSRRPVVKEGWNTPYSDWVLMVKS